MKKPIKKPVKKAKPARPLRISTHAFRADLRTHLDDVMKGQAFEITRYGRTVARIVPVERA